MQANKTADNQYLIPLIDGTIENIDITDGILLTTSEFVSQEDIEMTTTHDDLSLFQISFCIDGNMEWSYINNEVVHQFQIAAQQSQVRYGTFKECRSRISGNRKFKGISICGSNGNIAIHNDGQRILFLLPVNLTTGKESKK